MGRPRALDRAEYSKPIQVVGGWKEAFKKLMKAIANVDTRKRLFIFLLIINHLQ